MSVPNQPRNNKENNQGTDRLLDQIVSRENMTRAYQRVVRNKGSSGIDNMEVSELKPYLGEHWSKIKESLLNGSYEVQGIKAVEIPKQSGGTRLLGIPTVLDRLIQQAIHQQLELIYDPDFSERSYGFRRGRSTRQAVRQAKKYVSTGNRWLVNIDLSKFFDEVNHDRLISKLRKKVLDRRVIHLIERYLRAGMLQGGLVSKRQKGTPQGSPLSPLLSNIVLDELDKEMEKRGHCYVRYADDFQIYARSRRSAERVMENLKRYISEQLKLKVNEDKSQVSRPWESEFLGYSFTTLKEGQLKVSQSSLSRFKRKVRSLFRKGKGRNLGRFIREDLNPVLRGWMNYFSASDTKGFTQLLDQWIRRRLRKVIWQQQKRRWTRLQALLKRGLSEERAVQSVFNQRGPWWNSGARHMNQAYPKRYFEQLQLLSLTQLHRKYYLT